MLQLIVSVNKLNKRNKVPAKLPDPDGITGTVNKGFLFEGDEVLPVPNPALGKWYKDRDGALYWGGGLVVESAPVISELIQPGLPANLPENFHLGVDVSHHNDNPDWEAFKKAGASFAFIKISEGTGTPDKKAKANADDAKAKGLRIGFYHFCRPDTKNGGTVTSDATAEASDALKIINGLQKPDLPLVLDLEEFTKDKDTLLNKTDYLLWVKTFIQTVKTQSDIECMLYSRANYLNEKLPPDHGLGNQKIWLAFYPDRPDCKKVELPKGWTDWAIWQYTEKGSIGKTPVLDINILKDSSLF